jgi:hypothetical protein
MQNKNDLHIDLFALYTKFPNDLKEGLERNGIHRVKLIEVLSTDETPFRAFSEYNNEYIQNGLTRTTIPVIGKNLVLVFKSNNGIFTMIRKWSESNFRFYKFCRGKTFEFRLSRLNSNQRTQETELGYNPSVAKFV